MHNIFVMFFSDWTTIYDPELKQQGKKFICDLCPSSFDRPSKLTVHYRIHTGYQPFECDICHKKFNQKNNFKRHVLTHYN